MNLIESILNQDAKELVKHLVGGFKYQPVKKRLATVNNYFDLVDLTAWSYNWWCYFKVIDGIRVFNKHRYSVTTAKHQTHMRDLLETLKLWPDVYVETNRSLDSFNLRDILNNLTVQWTTLKAELHTCKRPKSMKRDNIVSQMQRVEFNIDTVQTKLGMMVQVKLNGDKFEMTEREYSEYRLQLSTGDFHMHKVKFLSKELVAVRVAS